MVSLKRAISLLLFALTLTFVGFYSWPYEGAFSDTDKINKISKTFLME